MFREWLNPKSGKEATQPTRPSNPDFTTHARHSARSSTRSAHSSAPPSRDGCARTSSVVGCQVTNSAYSENVCLPAQHRQSCCSTLMNPATRGDWHARGSWWSFLESVRGADILGILPRRHLHISRVPLTAGNAATPPSVGLERGQRSFGRKSSPPPRHSCGNTRSVERGRPFAPQCAPPGGRMPTLVLESASGFAPNLQLPTERTHMARIPRIFDPDGICHTPPIMGCAVARDPGEFATLNWPLSML
jgi:hypothetical protein